MLPHLHRRFGQLACLVDGEGRGSERVDRPVGFGGVEIRAAGRDPRPSGLDGGDDGRGLDVPDGARPGPIDQLLAGILVVGVGAEPADAVI